YSLLFRFGLTLLDVAASHFATPSLRKKIVIIVTEIRIKWETNLVIKLKNARHRNKKAASERLRL
ncbi:MAG TPA: hypothetical protein DE044_08735, partial [Alteromonas macleodii]|nr:hypothetical protein [Alteromonas macleodii]